MANPFWSGLYTSNTNPCGPLTFEKIQAAVRKAATVKFIGEPKLLVHPLRYLMVQRRCDPVYCEIVGTKLDAEWKGLNEQTHADYYGWGINGYW